MVAHDNRRTPRRVQKATDSQIRAAQDSDFLPSSSKQAKTQEWHASYLYPPALLGQTTWVIRRAKIWSLATLVGVTAAVEGTRLLAGVAMAIGRVPLLRKRAEGPDGMGDIAGLQGYVKTMAGGSLSPSAIFFLLNIWILLAVPFLAFLVHSTITHAHDSLKIDLEPGQRDEGVSLWKNPGMALATAFRASKRGLRRTTGVIFMGQRHHGLQSLGGRVFRLRSLLRLSIFLIVIITIIVALRQLLSLASLTISADATKIVSGPDIDSTASSLSSAGLSPVQVFVLFNFAFFLLVPLLLWGWYTLLNPSAPLTPEEKAAQQNKRMPGMDEGEEEGDEAQEQGKKTARGIRFVCMSKLDKAGPWWLKYMVMVALVAVLGGIGFWAVTSGGSGGGESAAGSKGQA